MAIQGETYVSVDANALNFGISPMNISGHTEPDPSGSTSVNLEVRWTYEEGTGNGGFTGVGWFWSDPNNILNKQSWTTEEEFKKWLSGGDRTTELDAIFSGWDASNKATFMTNNQGALGGGGCMLIGAVS